MTKRRWLFITALALGALVVTAGVVVARGPGSHSGAPLAQSALGTGFTYQGRLDEGGNPADGAFDLRFILFDSDVGGAQVGGILALEDVGVDNGLFTARLDFGDGVFTGDARWLEVAVRPGASVDDHTIMSPRQALTPTTYAMFAANAWSLLGNRSTSQGTNFLGTTDNQPLVFKTNGAEAMRIDTAGRVGINTTGPDPHFRLTVRNGVDDPRHVLKVSSDFEDTFLALENTNGALWYLTASSNGNFSLHQPSIGDRITVTDVGNIGIGTSEPTRRLDVNGFFRQTNGHMLFRDGLENAVFVVQDGTPPNDPRPNRFVFRSVPDLDAYDASQSTKDMMVIENTGNVGIGTSEPEFPLDVAGRVKAGEGFGGGYRAGEFAALFQDSAKNTIVWNQPDGGGAIWLIPNPQQGLIIAQDLATLNAGTGAHWVGFDGSDGSLYFNERGSDADVRIFRPATSSLAFATGNSERLRIDGAGNVGIGTTNPGSWAAVGSFPVMEVNGLLGVSGDDNGSNLSTISSEGGGLPLRLKARGGNFPDLVVAPTGNVGIGTSDPQSTLQVNGYTQLDLTTGAPPAADCDEVSERGRMKVDSGAALLWVCVDSGWVAK